jgi:hypothetical protein
LWPGIIFAVLSVVFSLTIIDYREYDYGKAKIFVTIYTVFLSAAFAILSFIFMRLLRSVTENYAILSRRVKKYVEYVALSYADVGSLGFVPAVLREPLPYAIAAGIDVGDAQWYHGKAEVFRCRDFNNMVKKCI